MIFVTPTKFYLTAISFFVTFFAMLFFLMFPLLTHKWEYANECNLIGLALFPLLTYLNHRIQNMVVINSET